MKILYRQQRESLFDQFGIRECYFKSLAINKDWRIVTPKLHHHNCYELHIVVSGCEIYEADGTRLEIREGDFLLISPHTPHKVLLSDRKTKKYAVCFQWDSAVSVPCYKGHVLQRIMERIAYIEEEYLLRKERSDCLIGNAIGEIVITVLRMAGMEEKSEITNQGEHILLSMAKQYIVDNIDYAPTVLDIARYCDISPKQLGRIFAANTELTPGDYIKKQQVERITYLLSDTVLSLQEISEKMHFSSVYYFNAFFKKHVGMPPGEYRKMCCPQ